MSDKKAEPKMKECPNCEGDQIVLIDSNECVACARPFNAEDQECIDCNNVEYCPNCGGTGEVDG